MALRQTTGFVESLLRLIGLDWSVADLIPLCRRQKTRAVNIPYRGSDGPLQGLIDSTDIKVEGEDPRNARKHGGSKRRVRRKVHLGIDVPTLGVHAIEVTSSNIGDAPMLPERLGQIDPHHEVAAVTADGAHDTRRCHDAIAARAADAVIPPRRYAQPRKETTAGAAVRNEALRASCRFGRAIWRRRSGDHRRRRAEPKMQCVKLLGLRLMARDFDRQVAELQARLAVPKRFAALGLPVTEAMG